MKLFGALTKKKEDPEKQVRQSIAQITSHINTLQRSETVLQERIDQQLIEAKDALAKNNRRRALVALKKKKEYERRLEKQVNLSLNFQNMLSQFEQASMARQNFDVAKGATTAMENLRTGMSVNDVEEVMDNMRENMEAFEEISEAMSAPMGETLDETELQDELDNLEQELVNDRLQISNSSLMPAVPSSMPATKASPSGITTSADRPAVLDDEDAQLEELRRSMLLE